MKINKSVEQAIYVLLILALQKDGEPLKSRILSAHLKVSDSYLKKILMKLKKGGLIVASASKNGGYQLDQFKLDRLLKEDAVGRIDWVE